MMAEFIWNFWRKGNRIGKAEKNNNNNNQQQQNNVLKICVHIRIKHRKSIITGDKINSPATGDQQKSLHEKEKYKNDYRKQTKQEINKNKQIDIFFF